MFEHVWLLHVWGMFMHKRLTGGVLTCLSMFVCSQLF